MGAPWIDYIIADTMLIPEGKEAGFSEKIIRLPRTSMPYERRRVANPIVRKDCGLPDDAFVFCSFNQSVKITGEIFSVWMKLLEAVNRSVLWLQQTSADAMTALHETAKLEGIDPARVIFAKFVPERDAHLARLSNADLALDCFPYSSHVTACDALSAGVPLVSLIGDTLASRVSSSILLAAGLAELITASFEEYFHAALRLAKDRRKLASLRTKLTDNPPSAIPLFDTEGFTRNLEAAYLTVWERHLAGFPPDHLTVNPKPISAD
jgi:predicted O-linked N-acetylglucosamine transferase (SPINDLY family)